MAKEQSPKNKKAKGILKNPKKSNESDFSPKNTDYPSPKFTAKGKKKKEKFPQRCLHYVSSDGRSGTEVQNESDGEGGDKGVNTASLAYIITKKYSRLSKRNSILDDWTPNTLMNKSIFRGGYIGALVFATVYFGQYLYLRNQKYGTVVHPNIMDSLSKDLWLCLISWPIFYIWSYNAYILQKLINWGLNKTAASVFQHTTQSLMFLYCMIMILVNKWPTTHSGYSTIHACVFFMKMHSYTMINKYYRIDAEQCKKDGHTPVSKYPDNISFKDFTVYMWMPILVYQDDFPRTDKFRLGYFLWKALQTTLGVILCYVIGADYVVPYVEMGDKINGFELACHIILPMTIFVIVIFFLIFEAICNAFAEITYFGDREFYKDWWNSTTFEEFNRKWNKCVYNFLFRHIYLECSYNFKIQKKKAQIITFFFSALLHEWICILAFKIMRPIMTLCMMQQLPLFYLTKWMHAKPLGNLFMWFGLVGGVPFIGINYVRSHPEVTHLYSSLGLQDQHNFWI